MRVPSAIPRTCAAWLRAAQGAGRDPPESAQRVADLLREQDERETVRRDREERRGHLVGGMVYLVVGVGLAVMIASVAAKPRVWTVGLIAGLIGLVLTAVGLFMGPRR